MPPLKLVFMGTPPLAAEVLRALTEEQSFTVMAVVTQPDQPKGRDLKLTPSPVKKLAQKLGLPVLQPEKARDSAFVERLRQLQPDLIAVAAYGQILPQALLDIPTFGCLNVHTSLLPKYRGAAPIQWAIIDGEPETGVTIMKMDAGLDTGAIVSEARTIITDLDNAQTLHDRLAELGGTLLVQTIPAYVTGRLIPQAQPTEGATYARKIKKEDGRINWAQPARTVFNRARGLTPWPGSFTFLRRTPPILLKILRLELAEHQATTPGEILQADRDGIVVSALEGSVRIMELQREGGKRLSAAQFLAGFPIPPGSLLD